MMNQDTLAKNRLLAQTIYDLAKMAHPNSPEGFLDGLHQALAIAPSVHETSVLSVTTAIHALAYKYSEGRDDVDPAGFVFGVGVGKLVEMGVQLADLHTALDNIVKTVSTQAAVADATEKANSKPDDKAS